MTERLSGQNDIPDEDLPASCLEAIVDDDAWGDEAAFRLRVLEVDSRQAAAPRVTMVRYQAVPGQLDALARVLMMAVPSKNGDD